MPALQCLKLKRNRLQAGLAHLLQYNCQSEAEWRRCSRCRLPAREWCCRCRRFERRAHCHCCQSRAANFNPQDSVVAAGKGIGAGTGLGVAIDYDRAGDEGQKSRGCDRMHSRARNVKCNRVEAGGVIRVCDRLAQRARAGCRWC